MRYLEEKKSNISTLIENQFPFFVQQNNPKFLQFLSSYYESLENKYHPLDIATNLIDYYNIGYYRPNQLIESTLLKGNLLANSTTIEVDSTTGFPKKNGYIQINNEIIFYEKVTNNSFTGCVRGTSALVLKNVPKSEVILTSSTADEHANRSVVVNVAYAYSYEFFSRIKKEIAPLITENVVDELDYGQFLKNIKSFYSAKGSLNGHRILFKILFNDKKLNVILRPRGSGAKLKINNYNKYIPKDPAPQIIAGGSGYDNRRDSSTNQFVNAPIIDVFGSGSGEINQQGLRPNDTAVIRVTGIDGNGSITSIEVVDSGEGYIGPITARVRERSFLQDQKVYNVSGTGSARVEYWDAYRNELVLYDVIGYFSSDDEIVAVGGESARAFIARAFIGTSSIRSGVEIIPEEQNIEFPREYTFKTSNSTLVEKKVIKCKILSGRLSLYGDLPKTFDIVQDADPLFGVKGVNIEVDNVIPLRDNTYEFEVSSNSDINDLYLPPSTKIIRTETSLGSNFVITVDDASRFPITNGIIAINGVLIVYSHRTINQFFNCSFYYSGTTTSITEGVRVLSWGRKKYTLEWQINQPIKSGEFRYYKDNLYKAVNSGTTGSLNGPKHTSGIQRDGSYVDGNLEPVSWQYVGSNLYKHAPYVDSSNDLIEDAVFELLSMPGDVVIVDGGSLHTKQQYNFANLDSPNTQNYNFTTKEISDRLAVVLSSNYNRTGNVVTDSRLLSNKSFIGFNSVYDYGDYVYVPTSTIPRWWNEIVDLTQQTISTSDLKKVSFTNQKLISRYKKSTLLDTAKVVTSKTPTKRAIGINADAIQLNSYKGNTVNYGFINNFVIGNGGDYEVPIIPGNAPNAFDFNKFPSFVIRKSDGTSLEVTNSSGLVYLSSRFTDINFNALATASGWNTILSGFTTKPVIEIINNNPRKTAQVAKSLINTTNNTFRIVYTATQAQFKTSEKVIYINAVRNAIPRLTSNSQYYIRKVSEISSTESSYSLHTSESDSVIGINAVPLSYINELGDFSFGLIGDILNPSTFQQAELDLSYNEDTGTIDNIIIRNSGDGYLEAPLIKIVGGGKLEAPEIIIPYVLNGVKIIEMRGELISYTNYHKDNYYLIDSFTTINETFNLAPKVSVDSGSGAEATAYIASGKIASVVLVKKGKNYYTKPTVNVIGNGKNAVIEAIISNGEVSGFTIVNAGTGYTLPPRIEIVPSGNGATITSKLNEWTFNLVERLKKIDRIDSFGGYVYHESDYDTTVNDSNNLLKLTTIVPETDLPPSIDDKQYLIMMPTDKLLAKYTIEQRDGYLRYSYPNQTFSYQTDQAIATVLSTSVHSPVICISYDGAPIYGKKSHSIRYDSTSPLTELKSRYRLKYSTSQTSGSVAYTVSGTTYYVNRIGGPSISDYPIGSFIEDYEFVAGSDNDLDVHNGRFCVTPEYPSGRYCYFATTESFDPVTNSILTQINVKYNGFPYFIGNTYSSEPDFYANKGCRTNDKMPKAFSRSFDKAVPAFKIPGFFAFDGLPANPYYPVENTNYDRCILRSSSLSPGSVDDVIIENSGSGYKVGDSVIVDNTLTFGSGFGAFVSKVTGKNINSVQISANKKTVTVFTSGTNGLSVGDYVYFDYTTPENPISINLIDSAFTPPSNKLKATTNLSALSSESTVNTYSNKRFYTLSLNSKYKYKFNIPNVSYTFALDIDKNNEYFVLEEQPAGLDPSSIVFDASKLPNILYLHIGNNIYEITTGNEYAGEYRVQEINTAANSFTVSVVSDTSEFETLNLKYSAKSRGATGGVAEISVSSRGYNYRKLPGLEVVSDTTGGTGSGAIIQANSSTIGKIRNVNYLTAGGGFTSNDTINHYLNLPSTAKVINNFEIYEVEVVEQGQEYKDQLKILVNGQENLATFKINVQLGIIIGVDVIDGGTNFETIPTIQIVSSTGTGCVLRAKIRRKELFPGQILIGNINSQVFPVQVTSDTVSFDPISSTLEFNERTGSFKENDLIYTDDGKKYGRIISIRRPKAYAKPSAYVNLESYRNDVQGNPSEFIQKITDSNVYQDWSYIISSSRDTKEWRDQLNVNTHPAGHKLFGKKVIERRKSYFDRPEDVFKTSVIFTANLVNDILLKVKQSPCIDQVISVPNVSDFDIGDYVFGTASEAIGEVVSKTEYSLTIALRNSKRFVVGELVLIVPKQFSFGIESATSRSLAFWNGIMQEPELSYETSFKYQDQLGNPLAVPAVGTLLPKFDLSPSDELVHYKLTTNVVVLDSVDLQGSETIYYPSVDGQSYDITSDFLSNTILSIGGSIQNPANLQTNINENYVRFLDTVGYSSRLFAITSPSLNLVTFTGPASGTIFTLNRSVSSACNLLVFYSGLHQTQLVTDYTVSNNTITFSETVELANIFGWFIDENVECESVSIQDLLNNRITGTWACDTKNVTQFINSSAVRTPTSLYELRKEYLDGNIYADPDNTTLYGFGTKFTYTTPEYSRSFVEVLDKFDFNGTDKAFKLTRINGNPYTPVKGKDSVVVYVDNNVLDQDQYVINGDIIIFNTAYASNSKCTIIDFNSTYTADTIAIGSANLDRLNVQQNGIRKKFNLSDRGVPQYTKNVGDIFAIRNGVLQRPDNRHQELSTNKITFNDAPEFNDTTDLVWFNRQLLPLPTKNVVLDDFYCFDGTRTDFPLTLDGINFYPINVLNLFVVRNGVYQKAGIDYRLGTNLDVRQVPGLDSYTLDGSHIVFSEAPNHDDQIIVFYSYNGLNQNLKLDPFRFFDGVETTFALTRDFISSTPISENHIQVYRNGVYQYSGSDYSVQTSNGGPRITFTTPPLSTDDIFVTEFNSAVNFVNKTIDFVQLTANTVKHQSNEFIISTDELLIYKSGLLITDGWTIDYVNQIITFDEPFSVGSDVRFFVVKNCIGQLDKFYEFDGIETTFPLTKNVVSKAPYSANHIQVYRNGVYQYSGTDYTVETSNGGPRIIFTSAPQSIDNIFITNFDSTTHFTDATGNFTQLNPTEFQYSGAQSIGSNFIMIFKDGVIQLPASYSYNQVNSRLTFTESILAGTELRFYIIGNQVKKLDPFFVLDGVNATFPLSYFYQSANPISVTHIQVYRNGLYQYSDSDYVITTTSNGNSLITFTTAPTVDDNIFITQATGNSSTFEDITNNFVQYNSTTLQNVSVLNESKILLIYNQGILQNKDSYTYTYNNNRLEFTETFVLNSFVRIFAVEKTISNILTTANGVLDDVYEVNGSTNIFPLLLNDSSFNSYDQNGDATFKVQVHRNGVLQTESTNYSVPFANGGPRINLYDAPDLTESIFLTAFSSNEFVKLPVAGGGNPGLVETNSTTITYTGTANLFSGEVFIFREGILQNKNTYVKSGNVFTFSETVSITSQDALTFYHLPNADQIDRPYFFDGLTSTYPLTKNNQSILPSIADNCLVYRNGVYQYNNTDYIIETTNGGPRITFTTPVTSSEKIFIQNFNLASGGFTDLTTDFNVISPTVYEYTGVQTDGPIIVFVGGIMQVRDSWSYNTNDQRLTFTEIPNGTVHIYQFRNCPTVINQIVTSDNQSRYALRNGRKQHFPTSAESLFVCIDGIVQKPGESYVVDGSYLVFLTDVLTAGVPLVVIDASVTNLRVLDHLETAWENNNSKYIKILNNYQSFTPDSIFLAINGIVQDPNYYTISNFVLEIGNNPQRDWDVIEMFDVSVSGYVRLDDLGSLRTQTSEYTEFVMTDNYWSVSPSTESLIVNLDGVVQCPEITYDTTNTLLRLNSSNIDLTKLEVINASSANIRSLDSLSDKLDETVDATGRIHTTFIIRNSYSELVSGDKALTVYGSVVQNPTKDYSIANVLGIKEFEIITEQPVNLSELTIFDVSKTNYELMDNLNSLVSQNNQFATIRLTNNYQTLVGLDSEEVLVQNNGIVQGPNTYNVINSTITVDLMVGNYEDTKVYDFRGANLRLLDNLSEDQTQDTFRLQQNYTTFTPANLTDIFMLRDSVLQNPLEDYTTGPGFITFTTNIQKTTDIFILYTHGSEEIIPLIERPYNVCINVQDTYTLPVTMTEQEKNRCILYLNGVPNFYNKDFVITGNILTFIGGAFVDPGTTPFLIRYTNLTFIDDLDNCPDGVKTKFKLLYKGQNVRALSSADILTSRNGIIQNPSVDYTVDLAVIGGASFAKWINFTTPLEKEHNTFFVRMFENLSRQLTQISPTVFQITSPILDYDNLYVFANGNWVLPTKDYTVNTTLNTITLQVPGVDVFAIEFTGIVKLLDDIHTPYDATRTRFNLFLNQENFVPLGTVENDTIPDENSILVVKNNKVLDSMVDYTLSGDIRSQIVFSVAPISTDVIMIKAVGSMKKLTTINSGFNGTTTTFSLRYNNTDYYPNAEIERPRSHENQILVLKDGYIQSPVFDYYIDNNKLVFNTAPAANTSKVTIIDFRGTVDDVYVDNRLYQTKVGDTVHLDCATDDERTFVFERTVTEVLSPTVLKTTAVSQSLFNGFSANAVYENGKVVDFQTSSGGTGYVYPTALVTKGSGSTAVGIAQVDDYAGGKVLSSSPLISTSSYSGTTLPVAVSYNNIPVRGALYIPTTSDVTLDVVILYHGTITTNGTTPLDAATNFLNIATNANGLNLGNKIIFSVAYPQDAIPGWTPQAASQLFPGLDLTQLFFGDNLRYAEAALLWAKNRLGAQLVQEGYPKIIEKIYTFGHSQGASLVQKLNTMHEVAGVIANAPGPINLTDRCIKSEENPDGNVTCTRMRNRYGSAITNPQPYDQVSLTSYLSGMLSPILFTQALDDDEYQVTQMQNVVETTLSQCDDCSEITFRYYATGGHPAFTTNRFLQRDIRDFVEYGTVDFNKVDIQLPGYNIYVSQVVLPAIRGFTYRKSHLTNSNITKATALTSDISDTAVVIPVIKTDIFPTNPLQIQIDSPTGSGASFIPYVVDGYLRKLDIVNGGIGYDERYLKVSVIGGGGSGAVLEPVLDAMGTITNLIIRNPGVGYDSYRAYINTEAIEYTTKTNTELLGVTRNILNYGLNPNEFPLLKNVTAITVHSDDHLQVFRNGVHQKPGLDFYTIQLHGPCRKIYFTTPVDLNNDNIFITHFDSSTNFTNISTTFTQVNATTIQCNQNLSFNHLMIVIDGIVQSPDAWSFDSQTNRITFDDSVNIATQSVLIYKITSPVTVLTPFTMTTSSSYTLSSAVSSAESIMVIVNGVVQKPLESYTVSGNTITFSSIYEGSEVSVIDFSSLNYRMLDDIRISRWINTDTCAIGHKQNDRVYSGLYL